MKGIALITGACGFIGFHLSKFLIEKGYKVVGVDNLNDYYDISLKEARLNVLKEYNDFDFHKIDIKEKDKVDAIFRDYKFDYVINLAGQAGVRYSIIDPYSYIDSNIIGFLNILEGCRHSKIKHLLYASSSSVYGENKLIPFSENHNVDHPVSLYAATKKSNELMAHSYSSLYGIPTTGLRFFTVYGPWGRPDMAYYSFTKNVLEGREIKIFNHGKMERDFTYIDDIIESIYRLLPIIPESCEEWRGTNEEINSSFAPYKIYNIGNNNPIKLEKFINVLEEKIGQEAKKIYIEMQNGDVKNTYADTKELEKAINYKATTNIEEGLERFVDWYKSFYKV